MVLTKLSAELLNDAMVRVECTDSYICALMANEHVIKILSKWAISLEIPISSISVIWGYPFVISNSIDNNNVIIVCNRKTHLLNLDCIQFVFENIVNYNHNEKYKYGDQLSDSDIWGLKVCLV